MEKQQQCTTMVSVLDCGVTKCVYNENMKCHTPAITVGSTCPSCDTFEKGSAKGGDMNVNGGVGACRKNDCQFNQSLECHAPGIHVGEHRFHADCTTYTKK